MAFFVFKLKNMNKTLVPAKEKLKHYQEHTIEAITSPDGSAETPSGKTWGITIIGGDIVEVSGRRFVRSLNRRLYSTDGLAASVSKWEGAQSFDNHLTNDEFGERAGRRSVKNELLAVTTQVFWDSSTDSLRGSFNVIDEGMKQKLFNAWEAGVINNFGLSLDAFPVMGDSIIFEGVTYATVEGIQEVISIDLVSRPAAGGGFDTLLESETETEAEVKTDKEESIAIKEEPIMADEEVTKIEVEDTPVMEEPPKEDLAPVAVALVAEPETVAVAPPVVTVSPEAVAVNLGIVQDEGVTNAVTATEAQMNAINAKLAAMEKMQAQIQEQTLKFEAKQAQADYRDLVDKSITDAGLAPALAESVGNILRDGTIKSLGFVQKTIAEFNKLQLAADATGNVSEAGGLMRTNIVMGATPAEKVAMAFMQKMIGLEEWKELEHTQEQFLVDSRDDLTPYSQWIKEGRQSYDAWKMRDIWHYYKNGNQGTGRYRALEAIETSDLTSLLKDALNVMVSIEYGKRERWYEPLVKTTLFNDIQDVTTVRTFGTPTLSKVAEGGAYTEIKMQDEEETATEQKRGNFVEVTLETVMNDRFNKIRQIPKMLSNSWYNTIADLVSGVFTINSNVGPTLSDTGKVFNATATSTPGGHANLLTTALSITSYGAAETAMAIQTNEPLGAGRREQIMPKFLLVPIQLKNTALQILRSVHVDDSTTINPHKGTFTIIVVPPWTDATDWALVADPRQYPAIHLFYPRGHQVPQLFTSGDGNQGSMFTNDTIRFKVQQFAYQASVTDDSAPVSDWRPLHKSNVAG